MEPLLELWLERWLKAPVWALLVGMLSGPPALMSVFLGPGRWLTRDINGPWVAGLGVAGFFLSIGVGVECVKQLPWPSSVRVALAVLYFPVAVVGLVIYAFIFNCTVYGECMCP